ncbi:hypothetical protein BLSTO_05182 [Blastocystis sp. subtype 1]
MSHILLSAETHTFPSGVAPFPDTETGTGAKVTASTVGYWVGALTIPGYELPSTPGRARQIKFSEPVITGFTRSFAQRIPNGDILNGDLPNGERREYLKRMLFSGGVGQLDDRHLHKGQWAVLPTTSLYHIALPYRSTASLYHIGLSGACPTR